MAIKAELKLISDYLILWEDKLDIKFWGRDECPLII
jgi:hypothetical protein